MSEAYVADARSWAGALLEREHRGPGDTIDAAMWRAEQRWGMELAKAAGIDAAHSTVVAQAESFLRETEGSP